MSHDCVDSCKRAASQACLAALASLCLVLFQLLSTSAFASSGLDEGADLSAKNIEKFVKDFTHKPHPFLSKAQEAYAKFVSTQLKEWGFDSSLESFAVEVPRTEGLGAELLKAQTGKIIQGKGQNIVARWKGDEDCSVILAGHYDTKLFPNVTFVGANDGGSSTALQLELARVFAKHKQSNGFGKKSEGRWLDCDLVLVFFDGEEAVLPGWDDGKRLLNLQDNLYGSRAFLKRLVKSKSQYLTAGKPVKLAIVIDMVGHKNQNLFITAGSDRAASEKLLKHKGSVKLSAVPFPIDDDHVPFRDAGIPFVHIIDWTNLDEWHSPRDTPDIISSTKIADFGRVLLQFLKERR